MVIFGVRCVCSLRNLKCSSIGWPEKPSFPLTRTPSLRVVTAAKAMPESMKWRSTPSSPQRKSRCHQERRNSPSVIDCRPTSSCFWTIAPISRSSTSLSSVLVISPLARRSRAFFNAAGRSRLPTWSARNGGAVRCIPFVLVSFSALPRSPALRERRSGRQRSMSFPNLVGQFHDHAQLRPLLLFRQHVAFLGGSEAALWRQAKLIEGDVARRLVDAALDLVLLLQRAALRGDEAEHQLLLALGKESQRLEAAGAIGVVFKEIAVDLDRVEQPLGHRLVATLRDPGGTEIAAARMHGDRQVRWLAGERAIDH